MTAVQGERANGGTGAPSGSGPRPDGSGARPRTGRNYALMLTAASSTQTGAAFGAHAFPAIGAAGVVAVRQLVAAVVLLGIARPNPLRLSRSQWAPVLAQAAVFAMMNLSLYAAVDRIGLALAVTLEFLGPLALALIGSRTRRDLLIAITVGVAVYVLVLPGPSSDYLGIGLGLFAAGCWMSYILLNRVLGRRLPGVQGTALATSVSALGYLPVLVHLVLSGRMTGSALGFAVLAGLLASAVPYALDLVVLRRVTPRAFGIAMSAHPVAAAIAGVVVLREFLSLHEIVGIVMIVVANVITASTRSLTDS